MPNTYRESGCMREAILYYLRTISVRKYYTNLIKLVLNVKLLYLPTG